MTSRNCRADRGQGGANWLCALFTGIAIVVSTVGALAELRTEVENPFRFFKHASDYAVHRIAFDLVLLDSGSADREKVRVDQIEQRLADPRHWRREIAPAQRKAMNWPSSWTGATVIEIIEGLRRKEGRPRITALPGADGTSAAGVIARYGWAALLDTHAGPAAAAVCWNRAERLHNNCPDYILPTRWRVRVFDTQSAAGECRWRILEGARFTTGTGQERSAPCAELQVDVTSRAGTSGDHPSGRARLVRRDAAGAETSIEITLQDQLVLGLGDSFSSGEGNPDRPVVLSHRIAGPQFPLPIRASDDPRWAAQWIDRSCHRSAYAWQLRAALHQTLVDPARPITFIGLGCSGAEIVEGLFFPWRGVEPVGARPYRGQLAAVYEELCTPARSIRPGAIPREEIDDFLDRLNRPEDFPWASRENALAARITRDLTCGTGRGAHLKRPVSAMLLGIGGNDVGFARWVAGAILDGGLEKAAKGFIPRLEDCQQNAKACNLTRARLARLKSRYDVLRRVLDETLLKHAGLRPGNVIIASYPKAVFGRDGEACPNGNGGMTVSVWLGQKPRDRMFAVRDKSELATIDKFRRDHLVAMLRQFSRDGDEAFTFIESFVDKFQKHGFCATREEEAQGGDIDDSVMYRLDRLDGDDARETLHVSWLGASIERRGRTIDVEVWRPFPPEDWRSYATRERWFRTPNDVFLTINNKPSVVQEGSAFGLLDLTSRAVSGAFHPTAHGHSVIATEIAWKLREKLGE